MPKPHALTIDPDIIDVLRAAVMTSTSVVLTGQLDRKLYERTNKVLMLAGGKWNKSAKAHLFSPDGLAQLVEAMGAGKIEDKKKTNQAFYTPADLAKEAVAYAELRPSFRVLEPSAGHGALADACVLIGNVPHDQIECCEIDPKSCEVLEEKLYKPWCGDFLDRTPEVVFDAVVMNPPFSNRAYIRHILHAFRFLKPGGRLVAILPPSWRSDDTALGKEFRRVVNDETIGGPEVHDVEAGAFAESGTNIATCIMVLDKADAAKVPSIADHLDGKVSIKSTATGRIDADGTHSATAPVKKSGGMKSRISV